jgi:hypothetical protein
VLVKYLLYASNGRSHATEDTPRQSFRCIDTRCPTDGNRNDDPPIERFVSSLRDGCDRNEIDTLPALQREDSSKRILRLRVSSVLKDAFAWNVSGSHRIITDGVRSSAWSRVKAAFLPINYGRPQKPKTSGVRTRREASRQRQRRLAVQPAREHGSPHPKCYAVHGSPSRFPMFAAAFKSACRS